MGKVARLMECTVKGMGYRLDREELRKLERVTPLRCVLEREPTNPHDPRAIKVFLSEGKYVGVMVGYVNRHVAESLSPRMDEGKIQIGRCWLLNVDPEAGEGELQIRLKVKSA